MMKCLQIEAKIFWLVEDSKVGYLHIVHCYHHPKHPTIATSGKKIQSLFKTTPQQLIKLINLLPFWNQFNQTELMFSPLVAPSFPQALYTLWKTYKQARVFRSARTSCTTFGWSRPVPSVRKKNLDHLYTGIYALWIMKRLIKPTLWPNGIPWMPSWPPGTPWDPLATPQSTPSDP